MVLTFWIVGGLFLVVDLTGKPQCIARYKVQEGKNMPIDRQNLQKVLKTVAINNLLLSALSSYPIFCSQKRFGCSFTVDTLPHIGIIVKDIIVATMVQEIIFYYSHRLFHHPALYGLIHRKHHQWTAPIGIVAIYSTPVEYLTGNGLSVLLGPLLTRSHIVTFWIWYVLATSVTIIHHSGYHLPFLPSPQFHDYHHLTFNWNYGTLGLLDWIHGTDMKFRRTVQSKRHRLLYHLTPAHIIFPDNTGCDRVTD